MALAAFVWASVLEVPADARPMKSETARTVAIAEQ